MKRELPPLTPDVSREERLKAFASLLRQWNSAINLVGPRSIDNLEQRHIADCLQLLPLLPPHSPLADLGSGAGLPGLVIAAAQPHREVHLIESDRRKAAFLLHAAAILGLNRVIVHAARIEAVQLPSVKVVTARAVAPVAELLDLAAPLLAADGICIFPKGRSAEKELTTAATRWHFIAERFASRTDPEATILRLSEIRRAGL